MIHFPVSDLHCDLLSYLATVPGASIHKTEDIGVALPYMLAGNVKHQVLAIYTPTQVGSASLFQRQLAAYQLLIDQKTFYPVTDYSTAQDIVTSRHIGVTLAIENASGLCEEEEDLTVAFKRLDGVLDSCEHLFYIGLTHHPENRFGGGNYSENVGLKEDGKRLLDYLSGRGIAVDLAHTSDRLAHDILNYLDAQSLQVPVIASHSNFRFLWDHVRNLPTELIKELIRRKGLIGMNFLRAYIHPSKPEQLLEHILWGLKPEFAADYLAFGADFFYRYAITRPDRIPLFFAEHENASKYPEILAELSGRGVDQAALAKLSYKNVLSYIKRNWRSATQ